MADERLQARLSQLRREFALGEDRLQDLLRQESALRETLLRISGAIQVLEELAAEPETAPQTSAAPTPEDGTAPPGRQILTVP